jgi:hypothetical protein
MRNATTTRRTQRLLAGAFLLCFAGLLGGCGSLSTTAWDPTDLLDFLDTKKKAPGERKPVFPEGVPGITQGVPKELVRGSAESRDAQAAAAAPPPEAAPPPPAPTKRTKSASRSAPAQPQVEIAPDDVNVEDESMPPTPPAPRPRQARTRTTAPPPDQPQANPFPAPR